MGKQEHTPNEVSSVQCIDRTIGLLGLSESLHGTLEDSDRFPFQDQSSTG
jgi:hypothetical protein